MHNKKNEHDYIPKDVDDKAEEPELKKVKRTGGGGKWRVYCHLHAAGTFITPEIAADLSVGYHARTDEEDQMLSDVGQIATRVSRRNGGRGIRRDRERRKHVPAALGPLGPVLLDL